MFYVDTVIYILVSGHRMTWQYYHRLADIHGYLDYLTQTYPNIVSVQTIGNSVQGKPLKVVKVSSGEPNSKSIWIDGGNWIYVVEKYLQMHLRRMEQGLNVNRVQLITDISRIKGTLKCQYVQLH